MPNLNNDFFDKLMAPTAHLSDEENQKVISLIQSQALLANSNDLEVLHRPWLLNNFNDPIWKTVSGHEYKTNENEWRKTVDIHWRIKLPNGSLLTDTENKQVFTAIKRFADVYRSGFLVGKTPCPRYWKDAVHFMFNLTVYVYLHEEQFQPKKYGFQLVDQASMLNLYLDIAQGNWEKAYQLVERSLESIWLNVFKEQCPEDKLSNPLELGDSDIAQITEWLALNDFYSVRKRRNKCVHRKKVAQLINHSDRDMHSLRLRLFFRQFEPDLHHPTLLLTVDGDATHKAHLLSDVHRLIPASDQTIATRLVHLGLLLDSKKFGIEFDSANSINITEIRNYVYKYSKPSQGTRFIPFENGLKYLNKSLDIIANDAKEIFDAYLRMAEYVNVRHPNHQRDGVLNRLNVAGFFEDGSSLATKYDIETYSDFTLVINGVIGALVLGTAILKPSRESELAHMFRGCVFKDIDGFWMGYDLGKSGQLEERKEVSRPIPNVLAKAIEEFEEFGKKLCEILPVDNEIEKYLFIIPSQSSSKSVLPIDLSSLNICLNAFCDMCDMSMDEHGRRWYVRIHELRKWFLLLLFWSGRHGVLEAARWIAGHTDAEHIYAYIQREFPKESFSKLESEFAEDKLRRFEASKEEDNESIGISSLYEKIIRHFGVSSLNFIPEDEWCDLVSYMRENDDFSISPMSVEHEGQVFSLNIYFEVRSNEK